MVKFQTYMQEVGYFEEKGGNLYYKPCKRSKKVLLTGAYVLTMIGALFMAFACPFIWILVVGWYAMSYGMNFCRTERGRNGRTN